MLKLALHKKVEVLIFLFTFSVHKDCKCNFEHLKLQKSRSVNFLIYILCYKDCKYNLEHLKLLSPLKINIKEYNYL